ncbi:MAG: S1 RNA-binding domain-containing protein [Oligoflexia bacterium]|nr:S1 RNA-binding domain-containing protein [Oligoflexia bacterium]
MSQIEQENEQSLAVETQEEVQDQIESQEEDHSDESTGQDKKNDRKAKTPFEHWLKRQYPSYSLDGMLRAYASFDEGMPVPYVAFYQKELTGGLKTADLWRLLDARSDWDEISRKQNHIITDIQSQGKLSPELKLQIERSSDLDRLEDLYAPFKLKRQTLGQQAREAGLGKFADYLWALAHNQEPQEQITGESLEEKAKNFVQVDGKYQSVENVLKGIQDILVEKISEIFELRSLVRSAVLRRSKLKAQKGPKAKPNSKYAKFFDYQEPIGSLKKSVASHRYFMMRKGWMEDELVLSFERPDEGILLEKFEEIACPNKESLGVEVISQSARLALKGNVYTVMENEAHRMLKENAEQHVIETLSENLMKKLLRPGIGRKPVMGIDPGTGNQPASLALIDSSGKLLLNLEFKMTEATESMKQDFLSSLENLKIEAIAIAHGAKGKETRDHFAKMLQEAGKTLPIVTVHEHTAGIYASSPAAKVEFADLGLNARRSIFVARFLQDPLSILTHLETKFFSLGEFQHEVNQNKLKIALDRTLERAVNFIGVDPNHASPAVLNLVAGVSEEAAREILAYRQSNKFTNRKDLEKIPGYNAKVSSGFFRFDQSTDILDTTFIPSSFYSSIKNFFGSESLSKEMFSAEKIEALSSDATLLDAIAKDGVSLVVDELKHFGEDPRGEFEYFQYSESLKVLSDLQKNTVYRGVVTNVTNFGAFVDIGIEQDGLVHISELVDAAAKNPFDSLFPGDFIDVWVNNVNEEKKQISLTMKDPQAKLAKNRARGRFKKTRNSRADLRTADDLAVSEDKENRDFDKQKNPRNRGKKRFRKPGEEVSAKDPRRESKPKKEKKPRRDPKTGAIVKFEEEYGKMKGMKVPSKAKPHTFNPFAGLADLMRDKQGNTKED